MKYGYIRVSSKEQDEKRQVNSLLNAGVSRDNIFVEKASGKNFIDREKWKELLIKAVINDIIVIKELDRLGRNNQEIKETFELLSKKGVFLEVIEQPMLNTYNKSELEIELIQPLIIHLLGYFAEKERKLILKRQKEAYESLETDEKGRKISRKKNKIIGRPNKQENLNRNQKKIIKAWINKSISTNDCIKLTGIGRTTLFKLKKIVNNVNFQNE